MAVYGWHTMVKFDNTLSDEQNLRINNLQGNLGVWRAEFANLQIEKLRTDAESAITDLETRCANYDTMCAAAARTIHELMAHYDDLVKVNHTMDDTVNVLESRYATLDDICYTMTDALEKISKLIDTRHRDLEARFDVIERDRDEMNRVTCSDVLASMGIVVGFIAIYVGLSTY